MQLKFLNGKRLFGTRCTNLITKWVRLKFCLRRACTRGKRISVIDSIQKMELDSSGSTASRGQQGCKRRRVEKWVRKKRKVKKDSGKAYKTYKGEPRSAKTLKASLSCRCQNRCASCVSVAERKHIFDEFYKLADHDSQNKYLYGLIKRSVPIQRRPRFGTMVARSNSFQYHVCLSSETTLRCVSRPFTRCMQLVSVVLNTCVKS